MGVTALPPAAYAAGVEWWNTHFGDEPNNYVNFSTSFIPALLKSGRLELSAGDALSLDELRVVAKFCIADAAWQHDTISLVDFIHFLARFGPVDLCVQRLVESLTVHRELVPWFHGTISRAESEQLLLATTAPPLEDGAFLVRFSDSQPGRLCVSYLKVHTSGAHAGRRETRNVLIENVGQAGFVLTDSRNKAYPSIRAFIQRNASRLKHEVTSSLSRHCNQELAAVRARQDLASNSYTTFSTDSLEPSSTSSASSTSQWSQRTVLPSSLLFTKSPPRGPDLILQYGNNQVEHLHPNDGNDHEERFSGFAKGSVLARPVPIKTLVPISSHPSIVKANANGSANGNTSLGDGYGSFSAAAMLSLERTPPGSPARAARQIPFISPPMGTDYGDFSAFTSAVTSFHCVTPPSRVHHSATPTEVANDNDYATFDSFVPKRPVAVPSVATATSTTTATTHDTYGAFEPFELNGGARRTRQAPAPSPNPLDTSDDYGSFAALSLSNLPPAQQQRPPPAAFLTHGSSEVYGSFTLSPVNHSQSNGTAATAPAPPFTLDTTQPTVASSFPPPASLPSDANGRFESLAQTAKATTQTVEEETDGSTMAPHSAPAEMSPLTSALSALDELNDGMELFKQKRLDDALLRFIRAREAAQATHDTVVEARALGNLGTVYLEKQNPQQAVLCYQQSLELTRSIQDVKRERLILNNLVLALMAAEDFVSAYNYCQIQLNTTMSDVNRRKINTRMSELRERAARASRAATSAPRLPHHQAAP